MSKPKIIFVISVDNAVDIITNSSSELFVLEGMSETIVKETIANIYPNYLNEYEDIIHIDDLSFSQFETWFDYHISGSWWPETKSAILRGIPKGFTFEEMYEASNEIDRYTNEPKYKLKEDFLTAENYKNILAKIDPERNMWFLFSLDENPNWEMQEQLMNISTRYHLG